MKFTLLQKKVETPEVTSFIFQPEKPLSWKPGQFLHYVLHHEPTDERGSDRWFTNSAAPFENHPMITTRFAEASSSSFKKALFALKEGGEIEISVVDGEFILSDPTKEYVFIAGGIGITPFRSMLLQADYDNIPLRVRVLYANRTHDIVFQEELEALAKKNPNITIHYIFSPEHIDEQKIKECVSDLQKTLFYVSGPEPMVESLGNMLKNMGVPQDHLQQDWFPGYPAE